MSQPFSPDEERVWAYLLKNPAADAADVALNCDVALSLAANCISRIGTPREVLMKKDPKQEQAQAPKPTRVQTLETAIKLTGGDRNQSYGPPFDNLSDCAELWNAYINTKQSCIVLGPSGEIRVKLQAEDVAWMMTLVKMTRSFQQGYHPDNYTDAAAYSAIAGECREIQINEDAQ